MKYLYLFLFCILMPSCSYGHENRKKIVVIDTGVSINFDKNFLCSEDHMDLTVSNNNSTVIPIDKNGHGTNIASIISRNIDITKYCLVIVKYYYGDSNLYWKINTLNTIKSFAYVRTLKNVGFVNYSSGGDTASSEEEYQIEHILSKNINVVVAAGNESHDLSEDCNYYPACYQLRGNFYVVGNSTSKSSNFGGPAVIMEDGTNVCAGGFCMTGTSQAAAIFMNKLIIKESNNVKKNQCEVNLRTGNRSCY